MLQNVSATEKKVFPKTMLSENASQDVQNVFTAEIYFPKSCLVGHCLRNISEDIFNIFPTQCTTVFTGGVLDINQTLPRAQFKIMGTYFAKWVFWDNVLESLLFTGILFLLKKLLSD